MIACVERNSALLQDRRQHEQNAVRRPQEAERDDPEQQRVLRASGREQLEDGNLRLGSNFRTQIGKRFYFRFASVYGRSPRLSIWSTVCSASAILPFVSR